MDHGRAIKEVPIGPGDIGIAFLDQLAPASARDEALAAQVSVLQAKLDKMATTLGRLAIRFSIVP